MKYELQTVLHAPRERVVEMFVDPDLRPRYQPTLLAAKLLEGEHAQTGSKTALRYKMGKREIEMVETVEANELPDAWTVIYESGKVWNRCVNRFVALDAHHTRWVFESEFQMGGFMALLAKLAPGMFKRESQRYMGAFASLVQESHGHAH